MSNTLAILLVVLGISITFCVYAWLMKEKEHDVNDDRWMKKIPDSFWREFFNRDD